LRLGLEKISKNFIRTFDFMARKSTKVISLLYAQKDSSQLPPDSESVGPEMWRIKEAKD